MSDFPYILGFNHQLTDYHKRYFYIDRKGIAYFINCYSGDDYVGELGWYKWQIANNILDSLRNFIDSTNILRREDESLEEQQESLTKNFTFENAELQRSFVFDANTALPDIFEDLENKYYEVIKKIKDFPWKTLQVTIVPETENIFFGDYLELKIIFKNNGTSKICFANPYSSNSGVLDFLIEFTKRDFTAEDISKGYSISIDLRQTEMHISEREVLSSDIRILRLEPGETLNLKCRLRIPKCSPGEYEMQLLYCSVGNIEDFENQEYIDGELMTVERVLVIKKR